MSVSDGGLCSVIGSNDGEWTEGSESSYAPSSSSSYSVFSSDSDDVSEGSIMSCEEEDDEVPCMDRPIGMMLAKANPCDSEGDFVCSKVRQRYEKEGSGEVFEVVFKDGFKTEYGREEVLLYKQTYDENEGGRGCFEVFFKV